MEYYKSFCTNCKYSEYNEKFSNTIPSIIICHNEKSEHYGENNAWCGTCESFEEKDF
jgi:hypothetical protein